MERSEHLVSEVLPDFSAQLRQLLLEEKEEGLASQVSTMKIVDLCGCGDDFCASFYVQPKPSGAYGPGHRNVALIPENGMIILDVVNEQIAHVEVLYRDDVKTLLSRRFGS